MAMERIADINGGILKGFMKHCQISFVFYRCLVFLFCLMLSRVLLQNVWSFNGVWFVFDGKDERAGIEGIRSNKFVEVPQIIWGLNNQKIALARAALTARKLNRTLIMPNLSASLFYKETDLLQPLSFDKIFSLERFNSRCRGFVQIARGSKPREEAFVVTKGSGRRWTAFKDLAQLDECVRDPDIDRHELIRFEGMHPFMWHDHWSVNEYATVFECLDLVDELAEKASKVVTKLRAIRNSTKYMAVHMRIEEDWMIHCKKRENRAKLKEGKNLRICSSKEEIISRVSKIPGLVKPSVVYLAVADDLLEDKTVLEGWSQDLIPYEKKKLGVMSIYANYSYLFKSAIDYEVCLQSDVFVGNSFSTFSGLVVLQRTVRRKRDNVINGCEDTYAYNLEGLGEGPQKWATNMSDSNLEAISSGSNQVSCT